LDKPFRGASIAGPEPYEMVYHNLMKTG
jgi:hypothetical protein